MRFLADGPDLPDALLLARDEGRVLFFCGAGVSRANANLPDFLGLAEKVLSKLRALPDSPARKLIETAAELQKRPIKGVGGILAADRIFGLLERDFALEDIDRAVGSSLMPASDADISAHRTMLSLSKNPAGQVQLVTTNFDLLFEQAAPRLNVWTPSQLPDLRRHETFHGIVHLHGMFDPQYDHAIGGNLVLSSAEFGRAYLAEGWATEFMRAAIERYLIVFVGYTADDPPVQYLLEALNRLGGDKQRRLYAFQAGRQDDAEALWKQKGVTAISYLPGEGHRGLWDTLEAWAARARDPEAWRQQLIRHAAKGPANMAPHQRGQIVHLASTPDGALALSEAKQTIPAEWLCVFDPRIRYGRPEMINFERHDAPKEDPYHCYALDSDPPPPAPKENQTFVEREVPRGILSPLRPVSLDGEAQLHAALYGDRQALAATIPQRLVSLAVWIMRVCDQPAAIWWAAGQTSVHPVVLRNLQFALEKQDSKLGPVARKAWRYMIEAWRWPWDNDYMSAYALNQRLSLDGWTRSTRRAYLDLMRPVLKASRPYGSRPPQTARGWRQRDVLSLAIEYSREEIEVKLPDNEIKAMLPLLRNLLQDSASLEMEIHTYRMDIPPIESDPNLPGESSDRGWGLNPQILRFARLFRTLVQQDKAAALREFGAWPQDDDPIFERMRLWAAGLEDFLDAEKAGEVFQTVSRRVFWGSRDQRDLLLALARRWKGLSRKDRHALGAKLKAGLPRERRDDPKLYLKWRAHSILQRLGWLQSQGCEFDFDVEAVLAQARAALPEWRDEEVARAADSTEGRGGTVHIDKSFAMIANTPLADLLKTALTGKERRHGFLEEHDPYAGLVEEQPLRVLAALRRETGALEIAQRAWTHFLQSGARGKDPDRRRALIARRLVQVPVPLLQTVLQPVSYWLDNSSKALFAHDSEAAHALWDCLARIVADEPALAMPAPSPGTQRDWFESSWSSVIGHLVASLLADPTLTRIKLKEGIPEPWRLRTDLLLALPGDLRRFALAQLGRHLSWLHARDPAWALKALIAPLDGETPDKDAVLAGFFSNPSIQGEDLFDRLRPILIAPILGDTEINQRREHPLATLFITAWHVKSEAGERFLSDDNLRALIVHGTANMRSHMLWHVERWPIEEKLRLFRNVWPLQLTARGPEVSANLCRIAFRDEDNFPALADAMLPYIAPVEGRDAFLTVVHDEKSTVLQRHPEKVLALLWRALPLRAADWPYSTANLLDKIAAADLGLKRDPRYRELRQRQRRL